jgi:hypothetical protein
MNWSQLEDIYGSRGRLIYNNDGDQAYVGRPRPEIVGGRIRRSRITSRRCFV